MYPVLRHAQPRRIAPDYVSLRIYTFLQGYNRCGSKHHGSGLYAWEGHNAAMSLYALYVPSGVLFARVGFIVSR